MRHIMQDTAPHGLAALIRWLPISLSAILIGCTAVPMASRPAQAQDSISVDAAAIRGAGSSTDSRLMSEILLAELAGRRGQIEEALAGYLRAYPLTSDVRVAERAARLAIYSRAWPEAESAIAHWVSLQPDSPDAMELLAQVQLRQGRADDAAASFLASIERKGGSSEAWDEVGAVLQVDPDPASALAVARVMAERTPDSADAQLMLAQLALMNRDQATADSAVDRVLEIAPGNPAARLLRAQREANAGDIDAALETLSEAQEVTPGDERLELGEAQLLVQAGRLDEAREAIVRIGDGMAEQGDDASPEMLLSVAQLAMSIDELDTAERSFEALSQRNEYVEQARFQLARISDQRDDVGAAIDRYEAVPPGELYVTSQVRAAELRGANGDLETARERLQTLRANVPDVTIKPQLIAAEARIVQQAGLPKTAVDVLTAGLEEFPDNGSLLYTRALVADAAGDGNVLEQDLERLIELEPDNAHALNALGYYLADANTRLDDAAEYIEKAHQLRPDDAAIADSVGWLRFRQGRFEESIAMLEKAWERLPDPEIAAHLIEVLWRDGQEEKAREVHAIALEQAPDDTRLEGILDELAQ